MAEDGKRALKERTKVLRIKKTKWIARALALALTGGVAIVTTACTDEDNAIV